MKSLQDTFPHLTHDITVSLLYFPFSHRLRDLFLIYWLKVDRPDASKHSWYKPRLSGIFLLLVSN